ncbi:MAG: hypothetical protein SGI96_03570 [Bacteroidota bacterium]|nr:hypothetical protein [Chitinophagaceae bacterium]MDZ4807327.1 hypothetical protein [Bacteroidota bacterium]
MKQVLLLLLAFLFFLTSYGQLTKKNWLVGGAGSFYTYNEDYTSPTQNVTGKYTSIDLSVSLGYFFVDRFSGGLRPYFSSFKGESSGGGSTNYYRIAIGPFVRYYFLKGGKPFNLLTDVSYQFGVNKLLGALHEKGKFNTLSIMGGTEIFFNTTAGMEILLGYNQKTVSIENSPGALNNNKKGFQVSIGFQFHLEKD